MKLGAARDNVLLYGLAGVNISHVKSTFNDWTFGSDPAVFESGDDQIDSDSNYEIGWRLGAGTEIKLNDSVSFFAQGTYTYVKTAIGTPNIASQEAIAANSTYDAEYSKFTSKIGITTATVGLNFYF